MGEADTSELLAINDSLTARNLQLAAEVRRLSATLQHFRDCADTPLMRDVMRERDEARARADTAEAIVRYVAAFDAGAYSWLVDMARTALTVSSPDTTTEQP